jgi:hypothetical protein
MTRLKLRVSSGSLQTLTWTENRKASERKISSLLHSAHSAFQRLVRETMAAPSERRTPAQKPTAVPVTQDSRAFQPCCCGKSECKEIKDLIDQHAPDDHVWKGNDVLLQLKENSSPKLIALCASVVHHLNATPDLKTYRVARHHWSQAVLSSTHKRRTNLVTLEEAKSFDKTDGGHRRHQDPVNKVGNIIRRIAGKIPELTEEMKIMYVQAPVQDRKTAREVALGFTTSRSSRAVREALVLRRPLANGS